MKTICITGCNGYLGLATAARLVANGYRVVGIGTAPLPSVDLVPEAAYEMVDVRDEVSLAAIFKKYEVDVVYHFAGIKYVGKCESNPEECLAVNTGGTESVLRAMAEAKVPKLVFASTYAVYAWDNDVLGLTEDSLTSPKTVYGQSKLAAEKAIITAHQNGSLENYQILRFGNIIGTDDVVLVKVAASFIDKLVQVARVGGEVTLSGSTYNTNDGTSARDFIDIKDVMTLLAKLPESDAMGIFNISSGRTETLLECIQALESLTGQKISYQYQERNPNDPSSITIDNSLVRATFLWEPKYSFVDTLAALVTKALY
jgi:UDP-glucose 4-epimerase